MKNSLLLTAMLAVVSARAGPGQEATVLRLEVPIEINVTVGTVSVSTVTAGSTTPKKVVQTGQPARVLERVVRQPEVYEVPVYVEEQPVYFYDVCDDWYAPRWSFSLGWHGGYRWRYYDGPRHSRFYFGGHHGRGFHGRFRHR